MEADATDAAGWDGDGGVVEGGVGGFAWCVFFLVFFGFTLFLSFSKIVYS